MGAVSFKITVAEFVPDCAVEPPPCILGAVVSIDKWQLLVIHPVGHRSTTLIPDGWPALEA